MTRNEVKLAMQVIISVVLLATGIWILAFNDGASAALQKTATGWIGVVIGYWLR